LHSLQEQLAALRGTDTDLPIGLGLRPEDSLAFDNPTGSDLVWIEPLDAAPPPGMPKPSSAPTRFTLPDNPIERGQQQLRAVTKGERELRDADEATRPVYTLPENATLLGSVARSEEHTSELQSREKLVCRLLLEKK